jgi:tetratricopeptide (TPR) repeat protein
VFPVEWRGACALPQPAVADGTATAEQINELGIAYHWKKDYDNALKHYRQAAKLDKTYLTSPVPILDHVKLYDHHVAAAVHGHGRGFRPDRPGSALHRDDQVAARRRRVSSGTLARAPRSGPSTPR